MQLTQRLRDDYGSLFDTCLIRENKSREINTMAGQIAGNRTRYEDVTRLVARKCNGAVVPWYVIGVIHALECNLSFNRHLHNGDPLDKQTKRVPPGRPKVWSPPYEWEESALDAVQVVGFHRWGDWSVPGTLYKLEAYNGFGYRKHHPEVRSPYLWSYSNHYTKGKYVGDGVWSENTVSKQPGVATILRRLAELGEIQFEGETVVPAQLIVRHGRNRKIPYGEELQRFLNQMPGIYVEVDGRPGDKTSDAFRKVTGYYLAGDSRAT